MPMSGILYQTTGRGSQRIQQCRGACRAVAKLTGRHSGQRLTASIRDGNTLTEPPKSGTVLYVHVLCPYAQRAWLALLEKVSFFYSYFRMLTLSNFVIKLHTAVLERQGG